MLPRVIMFDLDNTLAASKQPIDVPMAEALNELLAHTDVAITSGGALSQLTVQAAARLAPSSLPRLHLLPTSGAALFEYQSGQWEPIYQEALSEEEVALIKQSMRKGAQSTHLIDFSQERFGPYIENRGAQVSLSALGQKAPIHEKEAWDTDHTKREQLRAAIAPLLPDFNVKIGGLTTIDVTKRGISKAYGVRKLAEHLTIGVDEMLYVGDELGPGGNDEVVKETGIKTRSVAGPADTLSFIDTLLGDAS